MKAHIVTVINSRTRGLATMMMVNLRDEDSNHHASSDESMESEDRELYRLEIRSGKKVFSKSRPDPSKSKGGGKGKTDRKCFRCGRIGHIRAAKSHINGAHPQSAPKEKSVGNCEDKETETSQNVPLGTIDLGSFEVLSGHGDDMDGDESTFETTEMMPPLPLDSWFQRTETFVGKFRKPCNEDHRDEEDPCLDCWDGEQEQFDVLQKNGSLGTKRTEVCTRCERLPLSELSCLFCEPEDGSVPTSANKNATV